MGCTKVGKHSHVCEAEKAATNIPKRTTENECPVALTGDYDQVVALGVTRDRPDELKWALGKAQELFHELEVVIGPRCAWVRSKYAMNNQRRLLSLEQL